MSSEYIFRIEKRTQEHPLTPEVLVEFGRTTEDPRGFITALNAVTELLKIHGTPEKVAEFMKRNAGVQRAKLFVQEVNSGGI